ncbi:GNAT family N-acetyltransferase [Sporomusa aerivorans]|uniref:GNAT family N-acetyltransferase n=1 Tax=Sporomusa aerivorans TaxID=204936 RepID=UPI00352B7D86
MAGWVYNEFVVKSKSQHTLERLIQHFGDRKSEIFPLTLIAITSDKCVGTVSLVKNDLTTQTDLSPWLASLYVDENHRKQGIGERLTDKALHIAQEVGITTLFLRTEHAFVYYKKRGWRFVGKALDEYGRETKVLKYEMAAIAVNSVTDW